MAHKKSGSSSRNGRDSHSQRLGCKAFAGQLVTGGTIIVRQRGTCFYPGENAGMGKDHTIFAKIPGHVRFTTWHGKRRVISIEPSPASGA